MTRLLFDIETDGLDDATTVHSLVIKNLDTGALTSCSDRSSAFLPIRYGLAMLETATVLAGHNVQTYDLPTLKRLYPDFRPGAVLLDTLVCSRLIWTDLEREDFDRSRRDSTFPARLIGSHGLEAWGHRLRCHKGEFGKTTDWKTWTPEMQAYCEQDVATNAVVLAHIEKQGYSQDAVRLEHDFQHVIHLQEKHGFRFDEGLAAKVYQELVARRIALTAQLQSAFPPRRMEMKTPECYVAASAFGEVARAETKGALTKKLREMKVAVKTVTITPGPNKVKLIPFNPGSRDQVADRLTAKGWVPTKFTDTGKPQVDESSLATVTFPEGKLMSEFFLVEKRVGQIAEGNQAWLKLVKNGRIHGRVITNGAVTGRCTHMAPNVAQTPAVQVGKDKHPILGLAGGYGWECRSMFLADPGRVLVGADASGLELRCLAHYMARYDDGAYGRLVLEGDVHTANQTAAGLGSRAQAKTFIYAYLYGAGDELLGDNFYEGKPVPQGDIDLFKKTQRRRWSHFIGRFERMKRAVNDQILAKCVKGSILREQFEKNTPALASLKDAIASAVKSKGYLLGLDGRKLHVRSAHSALNTLLQSAGALLVKKATTILYAKTVAAGWEFGREWAQVAHIHDEIQSQVLPELAETYGPMAVASIREAGEHFKFRVRLDGEFKIGPTWAATH